MIMITSMSAVRNNIAKYIKMILETNEPLHITSNHGDFYMVNGKLFKSHQAYQMVTQEFCKNKIKEIFKIAHANQAKLIKDCSVTVRSTIFHDNITQYVKSVLQTNEPLHVTSIHGDFYIISRQQYESHQAYQMLTQELCESKIQELIQSALKGREE